MTRRILLMFLVLLLIAAGLGLYAWHLRSKVAADEQRITQQEQAVAAPANGPTVPVILYVAADADATLHRTELKLSLPAEKSEQARAILKALLGIYAQQGTTHPIGAGADVRDVYLLSDGNAVVDMNAAFADAHPSGVLAEELTIASVVATLNANNKEVANVKILVNGRERETLAGHADLKRFYLASSMAQIVKELQ